MTTGALNVPLTRIRAFDPATTAVGVAGDAEGVRARALALGAVAVAAKPADPAEAHRND